MRRIFFPLVLPLLGVAGLQAGEGLTAGNEFVLLESGPGGGLQAEPAAATSKLIKVLGFKYLTVTVSKTRR